MSVVPCESVTVHGIWVWGRTTSTLLPGALAAEPLIRLLDREAVAVHQAGAGDIAVGGDEPNLVAPAAVTRLDQVDRLHHGGAVGRQRFPPTLDLILDRGIDVAHRAGEPSHRLRITKDLAAEDLPIDIAVGTDDFVAEFRNNPVESGRAGVVEAVDQLVGVTVDSTQVDQGLANEALTGSDRAGHTEDQGHSRTSGRH